MLNWLRRRFTKRRARPQALPMPFYPLYPSLPPDMVAILIERGFLAMDPFLKLVLEYHLMLTGLTQYRGEPVEVQIIETQHLAQSTGPLSGQHQPQVSGIDAEGRLWFLGVAVPRNRSVNPPPPPVRVCINPSGAITIEPYTAATNVMASIYAYVVPQIRQP